jgi:predicted membrane-bound spermidine synthase/tetratricopeptide (TPR) repeat protein
MKSFRTLYGIFFLSGATGLVYELIWVRLTGLVFGNTSQAIAVVLGAFMAGLAIGSWQLGRYVDRVSRPLNLYGKLEIGIGLTAAVVPFVFQALHKVYWAVTPSIQAIPGGSVLLRFLTSFAILIVPAFLMGGTLPVLAKFFTQTVQEVQRKVGLLYALNTFGAAFGTLVAALFFIPNLGNIRTSLLIASLNVVIGLFAILLDLRWSSVTNPDDGEPLPSESPDPETLSPTDETSGQLVLMALAGSGFVSMLYEVAWTRALTAMIGSSTYAFSIMLVTFLLGIAAGSSIVSRLRTRASLRLLGQAQLGVALGGLIFLTGYMVAPLVVVGALRALFYSFPAMLLTQFVVCAFLMIVATISMGATLPIASQIYSSKIKLLGRSIGSIYSVNTLGAIAGSLIAGFVFVPLIGTERTILAGLFGNAAMAALILSAPAAERKRDLLKWVAIALLVLATYSMKGRVFWSPESLDQGIIVYAKMLDAHPEYTIDEHYIDTDVVYFKEGRNATISARRGEDYVGLRTNGKVDASNKDDMTTQLMIGFLPFLYHSNPKNAMIIGYGSGVTVGAAATYKEVEAIDCVEIEPAVVGAGPVFSSINRKSYENPKVTIMYDDARNYMNVTRKQYDVIISEPSNPWIAGVASLFTSEFYDRAVQVLKPDGVFAQWVQLYELDPEDLRMILHEFQAKFPEVSAWNAGGDLILIGTKQPQHLNLERWVRLAADDPSVVQNLRQYMRSPAPEGLLAYYVTSSEPIRKFAETSRHNSDDHPLLEFHAPRELFSNTRNLNVGLLYDTKIGLVPQWANTPDLQKVYGGMIAPLLHMDRANLANQAMGMLSQLDHREPGAVEIAMARIRLAANDANSADAQLKKASASMPSNSPLLADREELWGQVDESLGDSEAAIQHYLAANAADPHRPTPPRRLAELNGQKREWKEAAKWMETYVKVEPAATGHELALLGDYFMADMDLDRALPAFEAALKKDEYTFFARLNLAKIFEVQKRADDAIEQYEWMMHYAFDRDPDIYVKLVNLYKTKGGKEREIRAVLKKGHRLYPTDVAIYRLYREAFGTN